MAETTEHRESSTDLAWPLRVVCGTLFAVIVALAILQIIFRSLLGSPLIWTEELSRLLLVWMTFLAAAVVSYDGTHLRMDTIVTRLPPRLRRAVRTFNVLASVAFLVVVIGASPPILRLSAFGRTGALEIPFAYFRAPAPVGAFLMLVFLLLRRRRARSAARDARREGSSPVSDDFL